MAQKTGRKLKLQPEHSPRARNSRVVPSLKLSGVWLEKSGFYVGETVQVIVKEKKLIILPVKCSGRTTPKELFHRVKTIKP